MAINTLSLAAANAAVVYLVSPTRAAPAPGRWEWQSALARLPNNVFETSLPQRAVSNGSRAAGFLAKSAELCGVGVLAGGGVRWARWRTGRGYCTHGMPLTSTDIVAWPVQQAACQAAVPAL